MTNTPKQKTLQVKDKIEKEQRGIQGEKSRTDTAKLHKDAKNVRLQNDYGEPYAGQMKRQHS